MTAALSRSSPAHIPPISMPMVVCACRAGALGEDFGNIVNVVAVLMTIVFVALMTVCCPCNVVVGIVGIGVVDAPKLSVLTDV